MQMVVRVGGHAEGQREASVRGSRSGRGLIVMGSGRTHHPGRLVRVPVETGLLKVRIHVGQNFEGTFVATIWKDLTPLTVSPLVRARLSFFYVVMIFVF